MQIIRKYLDDIPNDITFALPNKKGVSSSKIYFPKKLKIYKFIVLRFG